MRAGWIEAALDQPARKDRAQLGCEHQRAAVPCEIKRLLAESVADQYQALFARVPNGECEHPLQTRKQPVDSPAPIAVDENFGVGARTETIAMRDQFAAQFGEVVHLAVVNDPHRAVLARHRLMARRGKIDDGEPTVAQRDANPRIPVTQHDCAAVVGAAMELRGDHPSNGVVESGVAGSSYNSGDSAHGGRAVDAR